MTQEERWETKYNEVKSFVITNKRRPSKYAPEERNAWNWLRHNQKLYNNGAMRPERVEAFGRLMALMEEYKRKNQYE